ncbi:dihydroneopterin aldolase [Agaribacterium haliotis]|uniref:dihydroneopterin aldolase n=1 Tax=Agaribacterium haliotis TaxID=2013869 RepID=UPI000BB58274|nr:dihydroneopterin aldolase [Agaribacterium haliotis]
MDVVFIRGLKISTVIGVYEHEKKQPQSIVFDVDMLWDSQRACKSDDLEHALDYNAVCKRIENLCLQTRFELVEALAQTVAECLMTEFKVPGLKLRLSKPDAIGNTCDVGIVIQRGQRLPA